MAKIEAMTKERPSFCGRDVVLLIRKGPTTIALDRFAQRSNISLSFPVMPSLRNKDGQMRSLLMPDRTVPVTVAPQAVQLVAGYPEARFWRIEATLSRAFKYQNLLRADSPISWVPEFPDRTPVVIHYDSLDGYGELYTCAGEPVLPFPCYFQSVHSAGDTYCVAKQMAITP